MKKYDIQPPERLSTDHDFTNFDCGEASLTDWLRRRANKNEQQGASRTYVVCIQKRVIGYYCLAVGAVTGEQSPGSIKRNMPNPIPVMILGRLAVDKNFQNYGIGSGLLKDAILRTVAAAEIAGIRAILVHALSTEAAHFYYQRGFQVSPIDELMLMISVDEAKKLLAQS